MLYKIRKYADNTNFANAVKATFSCVFPLLVLAQLGYFQEGFVIALGALLAYPSDVPGSLNHKIKGILIAIFLITGTNLFLGLVQNYTFIVYPALLLLVFFFSMLSV